MYNFLTVEEVRADQQLLLERYGGGLPGVLNNDRLDSAVNAPQASFGGQLLHVGVFTMAAAYLTYLVNGHAFGNANKRIGLSTALRFLYINGVVVGSTDEALVQLVLDVSNHRADSDAVAEFFRGSVSDTTSGATLDRATEWLHEKHAAAFQKLAEM